MTKPLTTDQLRENLIKTIKRVDVLLGNDTTPEEFADSIMAAVKDHVEYIIGENKTAYPNDGLSDVPTLNKVVKIENNLRAEQRNRAGGY